MAEQQINAEALAQIAQDIYLPAFMDKCAELGVPIRNQDELDDALKAVVGIKAAKAKLEAQSHSVIKQAADSISKAMGIDWQPRVAEAEVSEVEKNAIKKLFE